MTKAEIVQLEKIRRLLELGRVTDAHSLVLAMLKIFRVDGNDGSPMHRAIVAVIAKATGEKS